MLRYFLSGFGEINALFLGIKGAQTPLGASDLINVICGKNFCQGHQLAELFQLLHKVYLRVSGKY